MCEVRTMVVFAWVLLVFTVLAILWSFEQLRINPAEVGNKVIVYTFSPYVIFLIAFLIMGYGT